MGRYYGEEDYPSITTVLGVLARYKGIPPEVLRRAAKLGKAVHQYSAAVDRGIVWFPDGGVPRAVKPYLDQWKMFVEAHVEKFLWIERPLISRTFQYGGTPDRLAVLRGQIFPCVIEIKRTQGIDRLVNLQVAAERQLANENYRKKVGRKGFVVQLLKDRYVIHEVKDLECAFQGFAYALWLFNYLNGRRD